jgi:hypothetical protein
MSDRYRQLVDVDQEDRLKQIGPEPVKLERYERGRRSGSAQPLPADGSPAPSQSVLARAPRCTRLNELERRPRPTQPN